MAIQNDGVGPDGLPLIPTKAELENAGIRIVVAIPMERNVQDVAFINFWNIAKRGWPLIDRLYGRTDVNRNSLADFFLKKTDFTHLMMLDLDHTHPANIIEKHARWVLDDPERLVVGGTHFRRGEPFEPCVFVFGPDGNLHAPVNWEPGLYNVHAIGHGSLLISRKVFEALPVPWWAYDYGFAKEGIYPSEDMYFSYLCRQNGIKMWCDTTITSPHLITNTVDEGTFRRWLADNIDRIETIEQIERKSGKVQIPSMITRVEE